MDITSLRLILEGFSEELAESINLYDVLTIRGISSGGAATSPPSSSPGVVPIKDVGAR